MNKAMSMREAMSMHLFYASLSQTKTAQSALLSPTVVMTHPSYMNISILYTNAQIKY